MTNSTPPWPPSWCWLLRFLHARPEEELHPTQSFAQLAACCTISGSVQCHAVYSTAVYSVMQCTVYGVQVPGADLWHLMMRNVALLGWGWRRNTPGAWSEVALLPRLSSSCFSISQCNPSHIHFSTLNVCVYWDQLIALSRSSVMVRKVWAVCLLLLRPSQLRRPGDIMQILCRYCVDIV